MNVLQENRTAVLMQSAIIPRDRTIVHVNLDILEMDGLAMVNFRRLQGVKKAEVIYTVTDR